MPSTLFYPKRGFSLIELLVTLLVLGIVLGIAIPSFTGMMQRYRLQSAALQAQNDWLFARSTAVKYGGVHSPAVFYMAKRLSNTDWSLAVCSINACQEGSTLLRQQQATEHKGVELIALSDAIKENKFHNYNGLPNFTTLQFISFQSGQYQLQLQITATGLSTLCRPKGSITFGGYAECV
ncbi:Tfp pilus assembly protein FimT/FimU [Iodobacter sp.]|uniref:pilus assembly FimT family protein n=1 Tax=Iodobacter sp. TaxID=1915058 RepID=UPI0025FEF894|nr:prepilin-type N-terminal cleavage/methylation domain-containing protein [Iodobacter sp.]